MGSGPHVSTATADLGEASRPEGHWVSSREARRLGFLQGLPAVRHAFYRDPLESHQTYGGQTWPRN